ncbi:2-oxoacid:ferredoxin oxidoreductase subunit beta [Anaeromicrobium sediminis]|uniref:2-oxoacid ferredoxin oxidoreductase n=1 Tax=Anaeromicrobium sediminis TaxID=1478221 RepID=A0A267MM92_9FIRM|nr:2-oxoacid:ferredoxin oxidoreductase subunit beta [Anaeromicrobium sediminis]PAB60547.1 2-oxoacid ferredoxin oxidoreductase [Anaeromicrobium sediminis]
MKTAKDYASDVKPTWCPGCGHFSVLRAIQSAAGKLNIENHNLAVVSGIGCSGRISGYVDAYGVHSIHGRSLPLAQGIKMVNPDLTVIAAGGDGDGFAIGTNHTVHAMKRNVDMTYIVLNNQIYGLTKGHTSPISKKGFVTKSTPMGNVEEPLKPGLMALAAGATYIAQGTSGNQKQLIDIIVKGIEHKGFSFINVYSPCVTFNKINTYEWYKKNLINLDESENHNIYDFKEAMNRYIECDGLFTGILYENKEKEEYKAILEGVKESTVESKLDIKEDFHDLISEFM